MFNSPSPAQAASSIPKSALPGSIPQPREDGLPGEMVPDWNNIGLFTAGIAVGAVLGAAIALLFAPFTGDEARRRLSESVEKARTTEPATKAGNGSTRPVSSVGSAPYASS